MGQIFQAKLIPESSCKRAEKPTIVASFIFSSFLILDASRIRFTFSRLTLFPGQKQVPPSLIGAQPQITASSMVCQKSGNSFVRSSFETAQPDKGGIQRSSMPPKLGENLGRIPCCGWEYAPFSRVQTECWMVSHGCSCLNPNVFLAAK